ncbi:TPA: beta-propeller fold lactonase family protein [Klebsiella pneumoniae]|nr:beta-propeller fold lactonase family protein [Klebsiella pneumoniae]
MPVARHLLVASLSLFAAAAGAAQTHYAWVGTYNPNGEGLYRFTVDAKTGALRDKTLVSSLPNVAQLTVSRDGKTLYAASEVEKGVVQAWRIEKNGELTALNQVASGGAGPVYLSLTPDGKHLLVANYVSGSIAVLPVQEDGSLAEAVDRHQDEGPAGAERPAAAVEGSFAISDHNGPHAHMIAADPSGKYVYSTDLGLDRIYQYRLDSASGKLTPNDPPFIAASSPGAGPRHFVFTPQGDGLWLINEEASTLTFYILRYINSQYNYNLLDDAQLHADLLTHIKTMITRVRYQIMIPNPLLDNIKQHYPMAWDMTLAAVSSWGKYTPYTISENEIGFLVLHIGVGLERHYNIGYQRQPQVLLVCDTSNAMVRMIEAILQRKYPQLEIAATISQREYEQRDAIEADFVISTVRIGEKDKPVVTIAPFPTDYQLDQIGKLVLVDRTRPWMLNKYFDAAHFRVVDKPMDQQTLFAELCQQLMEEGFVDAEFHASVVEREAIVSTMLGDGIALPHSLGLLAKKTVVYTVIVPQGIAWGDETAHLIFLLAISKREYEEAMAIYDIFVTFLRERAMSRLAATRSFDEFKTVAMECVSRF